MIKKFFKKILINFFKKYLVKILYEISKNHIKNNKKQMAIHSYDTIGHYINVWGYYEWQILEPFDLWIKKKFPETKKFSVLDIGANIGNHTVFFSERFLKIFAYEPVVKNFKLLKLNTEDLNNVKIFNYGVSDVEEEKNINIISDNLGGTSTKDNNKKDLEKKISIEKIKLKNLNKENILNDKISLVKIDTEGMEYQVLNGISDIINRDSPIILYEIINFDEILNDNSKTFNLLKSFGYSNFYTIKKKKITLLIFFLNIF